jgi:hypothetical protein
MEIYTPALDDTDGGVITDPVEIVNRIIAFVFINPGDTSTLHEARMGSLGTIHMKHGEDPQALASEYEQMIQQVLNETFGDPIFQAAVSVVYVSSTEFKLELMIVDLSGQHSIQRSSEIMKLTGA